MVFLGLAHPDQSSSTVNPRMNFAVLNGGFPCSGLGDTPKQTARSWVEPGEMHWMLFIKIYAVVALLYLLVTAGYLGWRYWPKK